MISKSSSRFDEVTCPAWGHTGTVWGQWDPRSGVLTPDLLSFPTSREGWGGNVPKQRKKSPGNFYTVLGCELWKRWTWVWMANLPLVWSLVISSPQTFRWWYLLLMVLFLFFFIKVSLIYNLMLRFCMSNIVITTFPPIIKSPPHTPLQSLSMLLMVLMKSDKIAIWNI